MNTELTLELVRQFGTALLLGVLVGIDREKRKEAGEANFGGIRTFMLIALSGATAAHVGRLLDTPGVLLVALGMIGLALVAAHASEHWRAATAPPGLTSEVAALVVFLLGGLCVLGPLELAVALGVATSAVLAFKQPIHDLVRRVGTEDLYAALKLLVATFIVLPLLPRRPVDPWAALNPYTLWLLVILISALSLVGYAATRALGATRGLLLTGLTGGLVSSTAVTLALARRSREPHSGPAGMLAAGILAAWLVMLPRLAVLLAVTGPALARRLGPALALLALVTAGATWTGLRRASPGEAPTASGVEVPLRNPFSLIEAVKFAALFAVVLVLVKRAGQHAGAGGLYAVAAVAGLPDVDAISLSLAGQVRAGGSVDLAARGVLLAVMSNTVLKTALVLALGSPALRRAILPGSGMLLLAAAAAAWFFL